MKTSIRRVVLSIGLLSAMSQAAPLEMPAHFAGDVVFVDAEFENGKHLRLYTDTGGGSYGVLTETAAKKLGLHPTAPTDPDLARELGNAKVVELPPFAGRSPLPSRDPSYPWMIVMKRIAPSGWMDDTDGLLGNTWFGGHVWTWDYPGRKLLLQAMNWQPAADEHVVALGFKTAADGSRETEFPRVAVEIDGEVLQVLLDTGAETQLTPAALKVIGDGGPAARATSMIVSTLFKGWHRRHPDWRFIPAGQLTSKADMIEVPEMRIAGYAVGPVWFTERPDRNFHGMMSSLMDTTVEGAVGGNVFRAFRMTVDYPNARAAFHCLKGCQEIEATSGRSAYRSFDE